MWTPRHQLDREIAAFVRGPDRWPGSVVQALLFAHPRWTRAAALSWARRHAYEPIKTHETDRYVRLRLHVPRPGMEKRTIVFGEGIKAIVEAKG